MTTILETLLIILRTPGEIGVGIMREFATVPAGTDVDWILAGLFWLVLSALVVKLR